MDIKKMINQDSLYIISSADLKEFALELIEEVKAKEKVDDKMYTVDEFAAKHEGVSK
jgi:hypothetical protein